MFYTNVITRGNNVYVKGVDKGLPFKEKVPYHPYIFVPKPDGDYRTLKGKPVSKKKFKTIKEAREFVKTHAEISNFEFFGLTNWEYLFINDAFPGKIEYDSNHISVVSLDIENSLYNSQGKKGFPNLQNPDNEITAITLTKNNKSVTLGCGDYIPQNDTQYYIKCEDEIDLLLKFMKVWESPGWMPDIVVGWNTLGYDFPFLFNRISKLISPDVIKIMSPWKMIDERRVIIKGEEVLYQAPVGIALMDYMELYKKFTFTPRELYSLNFIAYEELGEKKLDYSEFSNLEELYLKDYQKFIEYNIRDCFLIDRLEDKLKLIKLVQNLAYTYKCNYEDTLATVKPWDMFIHHYLLDQKIVIPQNKNIPPDRELAGGYCKEVIPSFFEWILSIDVKSSYPHQIMEYNISPETFLGKLGHISVDQIIKTKLETYQEDMKKYNFSVAGNLCCFRKDKKGFMPEIMEMMFNQRAEYQNKLKEYEKLKREENTNKYDNLISEFDVWQQAKKISINAFYGMLANQYCRWFSIDLAEAVTLSGQLTVKWIEYKNNELLNKECGTSNVDYVCAGDTDSNYLVLKKLLEVNNIDLRDNKKCIEFIESFYKEVLDKNIKESFNEMHVFMNSFQQKIRMARENIANRGIWTGKKHYVLNVLNKEGVNYDKPKLKMVGIETVKSSTPSACRVALKECLNIIMNGEELELISYIKKFKENFKSLPFDEVAFPRGISDIEKYTTLDVSILKGTPIHARGALSFNSLLKRYNIDNIPPIANGDKIKFAYLLEPNHSFQKVIAAPNFLPREFKLDRFIDYETQYQKSFHDPLKAFTNIIRWQTEKRFTIDDLC